MGAVDARACDVVLEVLAAGGPDAVSVDFDPHVVGERLSADRRLALAFTVDDDMPLPSPVAVLSDGAGAGLGVDAVRLLSAECFDRLGTPLAEPDLTLR